MPYSFVQYFESCVQLNQPVIITDSVTPLKFQRADGNDPDTDATVDTAGWGSLNNLGTRPDTLHELTISVMERWRCGRSDYFGAAFTTNMICAAKPRMDTCDVCFLFVLLTILIYYHT